MHVPGFDVAAFRQAPCEGFGLFDAAGAGTEDVLPGARRVGAVGPGGKPDGGSFLPLIMKLVTFADPVCRDLHAVQAKMRLAGCEGGQPVGGPVFHHATVEIGTVTVVIGEHHYFPPFFLLRPEEQTVTGGEAQDEIKIGFTGLQGEGLGGMMLAEGEADLLGGKTMTLQGDPNDLGDAEVEQHAPVCLVT